MFGWGRKKSPVPPIEEQTAARDDAPPGETETIAKIQKLCWMAGMSAENVAEDQKHRRPEEWDTYEHERYTRLRTEALDLADTLTDEFYRNSAVHLLADLCMKAGDIKEARLLLSVIEIEFMRRKLLDEHPRLRTNSLKEWIS